MALLDEMLTWATNELKPWQSDAVRRLFQKVVLDDADYDDLLVMLKGTRGIAGDVMPVPQPLTKKHLPTTGGGDSLIVLEALHSLKHVNRLAEGQKLVFHPSGLTIVFGDNGAGKSGYSRVIKGACRARLKDEPVLPNAEKQENLTQVPEAVFVVSRAGKSFDVPWRQSAAAPDDLASVAILDTRCARAYTNTEGELIFVPYGLDVVEDLARVVFPRLEKAINAELSKLPVSDVAFSDLKQADTTVGKFLRTLTNWTTHETIQKQLEFTDDDATRLKTLNEALAEKSPVQKAVELDELATRIEATAEALEALEAVVTDTALSAAQKADEELKSALKAESLAAEQLRGDGGLLAGTGEGPWRQLYTAAQAFLGSHKHPTGVGAPCALCQTPLTEPAVSRMERFAAFVANDASMKATEKREHHNQVFQGLKKAVLKAALDETTVTYIEVHEVSWNAEVARYEDELEARRTWVVRAGTETHDWSEPAPLVGVRPAVAARRVEAIVKEQAKTHRAATPGPSRESLEREWGELSAREALSKRRDALLELVKAKRRYYRLSDCLNDLKTKPVSDKAGALAESAVTRQLCDALVDEFKQLGVAHLPTSLKARNERGRPKLKLLLNLAGGQPPEDILSEGEQRVIAIGSFFAELRVAEHKGAAVFDDPVSSLDHQRRQKVARRLIQEAKVRQIVVFTHDTVFLAELKSVAEEEGVPSLFHHLTYSLKAAGMVNDGLPWRHLGTKDRIDKLEGMARELSRDEATLDNERCADRVRLIYSQLREVVERGVEEVVFGGVLQRYNDYVRVPNIRSTVGLTLAECDPIVAVYDKAKDIIRGHDKSSAGAFVAPAAAEVAADIETLKKALNAIRDRRKGAKASGPPDGL